MLRPATPVLQRPHPLRQRSRQGWVSRPRIGLQGAAPDAPTAVISAVAPTGIDAAFVRPRDAPSSHDALSPLTIIVPPRWS